MVDFEKVKNFYRIGSDLSLRDAKVIFQGAEQKSYRKGELLCRAGDTEKFVYFISKGLIRIFTQKENEEDITFALLQEFNFYINFDVILFDQPSRYHTVAMEDTIVFRMRYQAILDLLEQNPKLQRYREKIFHTTLRRSITRIESLVLLTPEERYIDFVKNNEELCNRVPDKYIAHYLGITPVSLSRIRRRIVNRKHS